MANPIKETPVLTGKDALRFEEELKQNKKVTREEYLRAQKAYESIEIPEK